MQNESRLSSRSKNLMWSLKSALGKFKVPLRVVLQKLFGSISRTTLSKNEFSKVIKFGDMKVTYDEIDCVFEELKDNDVVQVASIEKELQITQSPTSSMAGLEKMDGMQQPVMVALRQLKLFMIQEDPRYIFDLYDTNKDGNLDVDEFNNLLVGCNVGNVDLRKLIIKHLLRSLPNNRLTKKKLLEVFGLEHIPKRISLAAPTPMMLPHDDKELANKYAMQSRIACKEDIQKFQKQLLVEPYPDFDNVWIPEPPKKLQPPPVEPAKPTAPVVPSQAKIKVRPIQAPQLPNADLPQQSLPVAKPSGKDNRQAVRYYRLDTKHTEMIDLLEFYLKNKETFIDDETPATTKGQYLHAKDIFKTKYFLFNIASSIFARERNRTGLAQMLEPKDIIQGSLGDCYFLSSISSLVEYYPELLSDLFLFDINPVGLYVVRLFNDGEWSNIVLDDRFPCLYGKPIFARPHGNEIWVLLLEKAWAKLHGSYQSIDLGSSMEALIALTGAPCKFYRKGEDNIRKAIEEGFSSGSVVTCSGSDELNDLSNEVAEKLGLIQRHAYSVQRLIEVVSNGNRELLVKIRNPWGNDEWNGDWSFKCNKWTEALRKQHNYHKSPQDGSFYMPWSEFQRYFGSVTVCKIVPHSMSSSIRSMNLRHKCSYIRMKVVKKGTYTISVYQESKRKYQNSTNYELSECRFIIAKMGIAGYYSYVKSGNKQSSNLHLEVELNEGEYMLSCKVVWNFFQEHECVVASYGPSPVRFTAQKDRSISAKYKSDIIHSYLQQYPGERYTYEKLNIPEAYRELAFNIEHGIGFIRVNNPSKKSFSTTISLNKAKGIKVIKPGELPLKLTMLPQTESITGFFISAKGFSYSLEEKMKAST